VQKIVEIRIDLGQEEFHLKKSTPRNARDVLVIIARNRIGENPGTSLFVIRQACSPVIIWRKVSD